MSSSTIKIGIDLGGTKIAGVAIDRDGKVLRANRLDTPTSGYDAIMDAIDALVNELDPTGDVPIGVGTPGAISPTSGTLRNANTVCLNGTPFPEDLSRRCGRSVRIANDANCFALSEAVDGAGRDAHCVFGVILGTGVGGGVVYSRRLLEGRNAIGGEWGHNPLPWPAAHE
ncbi:MAG: ROK family protein, partial [Pseudomonadota bacterium]